MKNKFIKEYFNFSTRERNGIIVLSFVILIIILARLVIDLKINNKNYDFIAFEEQIVEFTKNNTNDNNIDIELFYFDPNYATDEDFQKLGLSNKAIKSILNYREKGGKFYTPEDLKKMYNVTPEEYEKLKDYIIISDTKKNYNPQKNNKKQKKENIKTIDTSLKIIDTIPNQNKFNNKTKLNFEEINLNIANAEELQKLNGIGTVYSKRIIEYREKLGGFKDLQQLLEVYGFSEELLLSISPYLSIDENNIRKININNADFKELIQHPYINKDNASKILSYRKLSKEIKSVEELLKQKVVSKEFYEKINPYITIE